MLFRTKLSSKSHITTHLLLIPNSIIRLLLEESRTAVVQIDKTHRTDKYRAGMLHEILPTSINIK